jgi:cell division protein YceG involved in septum cleavage
MLGEPAEEEAMFKKTVVLAAVVLVVAVLSCQTTGMNTVSRARPHPLHGNWEFVSGRFTLAEGTVRTADSTELRSIKVIGPTRFSFVTLRADGSLARAAAGRYTISGNTYTEYLDLTSPADAQGSTGVFTWRVEGDTWYHNGESRGVKFEELWRRAR